MEKLEENIQNKIHKEVDRKHLEEEASQKVFRVRKYLEKFLGNIRKEIFRVKEFPRLRNFQEIFRLKNHLRKYE